MSDEKVNVEIKPTHVVIDNTNLDAVLAEARGEPLPKEVPKEELKTEVKTETKSEPEEDDDGLTPEQKATFTENMKKTIGKKHREKKEAEELAEEQYNARILADRRAEKAEREAQRLREQLTPAPKVEEAKEPDRANFKTDKEYADAMIDFRVDQKLKAKEAEDHKKALEDLQREAAAQAIARIEKARELVPDFDEVLASVDDDKHPVSQTIAGYMQESDMFAELGYHFAKNPEVLDNIMKLSPTKQLVAIGKIESTLKPFSGNSEKATTDAKSELEDGKATKPAPSTNGIKPSKARPEPIKPLETGSASQVEKPVSEMSFQEYKSHWQEKHKVKLGLRKRH